MPTVYFVTGLRDRVDSFILVYLVSILTVASMQSMGLAISAGVSGARTMPVAMLVVTVSLKFFVTLFSWWWSAVLFWIFWIVQSVASNLVGLVAVF